MRLPDGTRRRASRPLMLAGYAELANLCSAEGDAYLTLAEASGRSKWLGLMALWDRVMRITARGNAGYHRF